MMENENKLKSKKKKLPSGIAGFDEIARGGFPQRKTSLVSGTSGSGKTVFVVQFLYKGIMEHGENGVFVTFEEPPEEIIGNMEDFGWNIKQLIDEKKWMFVDASPDEEAEVEIGKYNLRALLLRIEHAIKTVDAKRVAVDSVSALFPRYEDASVIRRELYNISTRLKKMGITSVITAERPVEEGTIARFGIEEFVADGVVLLHNRLTGHGDRERTVEILKFRGTGHDSTEAPLIVGDNGMEIFPRPKPELFGEGFTEKLSTGISGLDDMLHGGVYKNSTTLITGASGTGKTVSALHFILEGAKNGEKCMLMEFEESPKQLFRNAESFGWDLREFVDKGAINLICHYPEDLKAEQYLKVIKDLVVKSKPRRIAIDSLSALERIYDPDKFREFVIGLNAFLKMHDCTSFMTNTTDELIGMSKITSTHLSTTTDNIIVLKYIELEGAMRRLCSVLKARGSDHRKELAKFHIGKTGFEITGYYTGFEGLLSGSARKISISFGEENAEQEFLKEIEKTNIEPETSVMPEVGKASAVEGLFEEKPEKKGFIEGLREEIEKRRKK